jgi:hypothetical protein
MRDQRAERSFSVRRAGTVAAVVAVVAIVSGAARGVAYSEDVSRAQVAELDRFLDDHPWVQRDLRQDPSLVNDPEYLDDHRSLRDFLADNPSIRRALRDDPWAVLRREHRYDREERRSREVGRDDLQRFTRFLRDHPAVAHDLRSDPSLATSRRYLATHRSFGDFLADNPAIREELQDNPYAFLRRVERYARETGRRSKPPQRH